MKSNKIWKWLTMIFAGFSAGLVTAFQLMKGNINNEQINIKKPKMKRVNDSIQQFTSSINKKKKRRRLFNRKKKKNEKNMGFSQW